MDGIIAERLQRRGDVLQGRRPRERREESSVKKSGRGEAGARKARAELQHSKFAGEDAAVVCQKGENMFMFAGSTGVPKTANGGARGGY